MAAVRDRQCGRGREGCAVREAQAGAAGGGAMIGLRAITVRQPWARLLAAGVKTVESRARRVAYRGPVAIHAAESIDEGAMTVLAAGERPWGRRRALAGVRQELGVIVAVARLTGCHAADGECCGTWAGRGRWHLTLGGARALTDPVPVPDPGSPAMPWQVGSSAADLVWRQLADLSRPVRCDRGRRGRLDVIAGTPLSAREAAVIRGASDGQSNISIAVSLGITENTVKAHMQRAMAKLSARNRAHAVAAALRDGVIS
jgi:DNA-binding CsgD family transcriptional regulator